jgi:hypothetical protein
MSVDLRQQLQDWIAAKKAEIPSDGLFVMDESHWSELDALVRAAENNYGCTCASGHCSLHASGGSIELFRRHTEDLPPRSLVYPASQVDAAFALVRAASPPAPLTYVAEDPEPDLPADECTTAALLRKIADHLDNGNWRVVADMDCGEWIHFIRDRAARLEQRAAGGVRSAGPQAPPPHVQQTINEMRSAVELSKQFGTPVADHQLILDWANQLENSARGDAARVPPSQERTRCGICGTSKGLLHVCPQCGSSEKGVIDVRVPPVTPRLSVEDIDQIVEGIEHFCIGADNDDAELDAIWRPYINKLTDLRADLMLAAPATPQEK